MSGFLLDTNIRSELVRPQPEPKVRAWLAAQNLDSLFMSSVSFGELRKGITLVTRNTKDFESLGLALINPWLESKLSN